RFADLERRLDVSSGLTSVAESPLLHNLDRPLADQLVEAVRARADRVDELAVTAPFYDEQSEAIGHLIDELHPAHVRIFMTRAPSADGPRPALRLAAPAAEVETLVYMPDRFTHAKLIGIVADETGFILSGSANASRAALTLPAGVGNVELAVLSEVEPDV